MSKLAGKIRAQFIRMLLLFAVALMVVAAAGVWGLGQTRKAAHQLYDDHLRTAQVTAAVSQDLDDAYETAQSLLLAGTPADRARLNKRLFATEVPDLEVSLQTLQKLHANDPPSERALVRALVNSWARFRTLWTPDGLLAATPNTAVVGARLRSAFDPIEPVTDGLQTIEQHDAQLAHKRGDTAYNTSLILIGVVVGAALLAGVTLVLFVTRRVLPRSMAPEQAQAAFVEALQLAEDEGGAQTLLKRHLERATPGGEVVVLNRTDQGDGLVAMTPLTENSALRAPLAGATARSCAAIRSARPHYSRAGQDELQPCQVCSTCPGMSLCTPVTVGGQIVGSVLVNRSRGFDADDERTIHDSITQAAPILANVRNLASAESQAATDTLTGLPNKRSGADTLKRMVAHAGRTLAPLAALSIDLDHFKAMNDLHGHSRGDDVLAAVGVALQSTLRASDFAARNGGEEFLVLLPSTGIDEAMVCAKKMQTALRQIPILAGESPISASIGIAVLPDHAHDPTSLAQAADRAVYAAKRNGRDRVEIATNTADPSATELADNRGAPAR